MRILLAVLTACTLATSLGTAQAQVWDNGPGYIGEPPPPRYYREAPRRHHRGGIDAGDALLGGAIGLAAGALLGSALSQPQQAPAPTYYPPQPRQSYPAYGVAPPSYEDTVPARRTYRQPRQARYYDDYGTYTRRDHVEACLARYRSYDPRTDTFVGNDGYRRRCQL